MYRRYYTQCPVKHTTGLIIINDKAPIKIRSIALIIIYALGRLVKFPYFSVEFSWWGRVAHCWLADYDHAHFDQSCASWNSINQRVISAWILTWPSYVLLMRPYHVTYSLPSYSEYPLPDDSEWKGYLYTWRCKSQYNWTPRIGLLHPRSLCVWSLRPRMVRLP